MEYIGEAMIITDDYMHINLGDIVDVYQYEYGEELDDSSEICSDETYSFRIVHGRSSIDCDDSDFELL